MRGRAPRWRVAAGGAGALLALAALATALTWQTIFDAVLASQLTMTPTSRSYHQWKQPPDSIPLYFEVYLFNWTNADKFPEEVPNMVQLGPYRFREVRQHVNVTWHNHNGSLAYRTLRRFFFDAATSNGTLKDNITTLNVIAASAVYRSRDWGFLRQKGLSMGLAMFGQGISVSKLAGEILFEGYEDPLLDLAKSLPPSATGGAPPVDRFGWFYGRNNSLDTDGYVEISTGVDGALPGQILRWNHEDHIPYYSGHCAQLAGSAGEFLPRNLTEDSQLMMFVPDLCRTVHMDYVHSGEIAGLEYHKYALSQRSFDNSTLSPSNTCFCNGQCAWSGVMNVSACRFGSPAFISLPHFLHGDPVLLDMVTGLNPDPEKHEFYFAIEPKLGIPLEVAARFQVNVLIEPSPNIALFENVPRMLFPVFWVQEKVLIDEQISAELRIVRATLDWGATVCACAALAFAVLVAMATWCMRKHVQHDLKFEKPKDEAELKLNPK
ncbi:protein peste-like [Pectinophora gossypiella]|uniref:protein peste-like n=1 Tax=Pectinophora gossypiella TaxID=13191 RepID=UPI00214EEE2B|nr:protein peste-like [Pectinophora gossypiella]